MGNRLGELGLIEGDFVAHKNDRVYQVIGVHPESAEVVVSTPGKEDIKTVKRNKLRVLMPEDAMLVVYETIRKTDLRFSPDFYDLWATNPTLYAIIRDGSANGRDGEVMARTLSAYLCEEILYAEVATRKEVFRRIDEGIGAEYTDHPLDNEYSDQEITAALREVGANWDEGWAEALLVTFGCHKVVANCDECAGPMGMLRGCVCPWCGSAKPADVGAVVQ